MFSKILIANRGEIAVRIIRACKEMGISTVAVYSEADKESLFVQLADESYCIGKASAADSYLNEERIISAAKVSGAQAIHPGYGFLSENEHFARLCQRFGIVFIGPDPECMERVSDKARIKKIMEGTNLTPIPGTEALPTVEDAVEAASQIRYPVMLKACFGGGGRGIRLIRNEEELRRDYPLAVAESEAAFGDGSVYIEKYVFPARHIEMQIIADEYGNVVCLGERDCSVQRRHQKLIEESPSPGVNKASREKLINDVTEAVKKMGYSGVGTLEFLMDREGNFWFMEMNVRLQVEHCVTESLTRIDMVKWQIRIAAGVKLSFTQEDITLTGSSIECRINALAPGKLQNVHIPGGPFLRFDGGVIPGTMISPYYDSLIGKLIVYASTREEAVRKMRSALCEIIFTGISTNIPEQLDIISDPCFSSGNYDLTFMEGR
ncbi:MAG: acetyl-CoA carboxylase biotin carboxylase subunit [Parasporobacterium sp.]|nr:acetyl-CoA carboxylase biotin carboxylase subunit [Parasporobacterium sp.]